MHRLWPHLVVLLLSLEQVACNTGQMLGAEPHLVWLDKQETETQSIMQTLAISISRMEDATVRELPPDERRLAVDAQLEIIEELSELLGTESANVFADNGANHSHVIVDNYIDDFLAQVRQARTQLQKSPPNYFVAGMVAGHCQMCHDHRDNTAK